MDYFYDRDGIWFGASGDVVYMDGDKFENPKSSSLSLYFYKTNTYSCDQLGEVGCASNYISACKPHPDPTDPTALELLSYAVSPSYAAFHDTDGIWLILDKNNNLCGQPNFVHAIYWH